MSINRIAVAVFFFGTTLLIAGGVLSQTYPTKPIRIVTGGATGASGMSSRFVAQGISGPLGQQVIVDSRGGGAILGEIVGKSVPDGYTLLVSGSSFWIAPLLQKMPYDPVKDLTPVSIVGSTPFILVVHPALPVKSVKELIALAKSRPGQLNYSVGGIGSTSQLATESFKSTAGVNLMVVSYSSESQELTDLLSGAVQMTFGTPSSVMEQVRRGKLRALAVTSIQRSALAPDLPTVASSGVPNFEATQIVVMFAPAKTPDAIVSRLSQEVVRFLKTAEAKEMFLRAGVEAIGSSPEQLASTMRSEMARWEKVIKDAGIKVQ